MNRIKIFISSVQNKFAKERRQIADYIRQDSLFSMYFDPFSKTAWKFGTLANFHKE